MANRPIKMKPIVLASVLTATWPLGASGVQSSPIGLAGEVMDGGFLLQFFAGLAVVIMCIVGLAWVLKRTGGFRASAQGSLRVIDGIALSTRERIVLVQVGDRQVLLGVAPGRVNAVYVLDDPVDLNSAATPPAENFATRLRDVLGKEKQS